MLMYYQVLIILFPLYTYKYLNINLYWFLTFSLLLKCIYLQGVMLVILFYNNKTFLGVEQLIRHLHKNNVPFAIATSSGKTSYEKKIIKHRSLFSLFNHVVNGATDPEVKNGKPAPDIFLTCASRFPDKPSMDKVTTNSYKQFFIRE